MQSILDFINGKKTYITGAVGILLGILVATGKLSPEQKDVANKDIVGLLDQIGSVLITLTSLSAIFIRHGISTTATK